MNKDKTSIRDSFRQGLGIGAALLLFGFAILICAGVGCFAWAWLTGTSMAAILGIG